MKKLSTWLGIVLALQIIFSIGLYTQSQKTRQNDENKVLLSFNTQQLDKILIRDKDNASTLLKKGANWTLPELKQLPADVAKLKGLLGKLENLQAGWPVATSTSSHQRFEVSEKKYQRRLQLYQGDQLQADLYIGTSPGFRKVHLRKAGQDAVYAVKLNTFDLPSSNSEWLDKNLLAAENISAIQGKDYHLEKHDTQWQLKQGQKEDERINEENLQKLLSALRNLKITELVETPVDQQAKDETKLTVTQKGGTLQYRLFQVDQQYFIRRDDHPHTFSLAEFDYLTLSDISLESLLMKKELEDNSK